MLGRILLRLVLLKTGLCSNWWRSWNLLRCSLLKVVLLRRSLLKVVLLRWLILLRTVRQRYILCFQDWLLHGRRCYILRRKPLLRQPLRWNGARRLAGKAVMRKIVWQLSNNFPTGGMVTVDGYTHATPATSLRQARVRLSSFILGNDPLRKWIVFNVAQHLFVLVVLVQLCHLPVIVELADTNHAVHQLPLLAHAGGKVHPWPVGQGIPRLVIVRRRLDRDDGLILGKLILIISSQIVVLLGERELSDITFVVTILWCPGSVLCLYGCLKIESVSSTSAQTSVENIPSPCVPTAC